MTARAVLENRARAVSLELAKEGVFVEHVVLCPFHDPPGPLAVVAKDGEDILCIHDQPTCREYETKDIPDYLHAVTTRLKNG